MKANVVLIMLLQFGCTLLMPKLQAQETLTGLQFNAAIQKQIPNKSTQLELKLALPFFEDFSTSNIYPDKARWDDSYVFINKDFPLYPTNIGAATFDVLDDKGKVYKHASSTPFIADYLTSADIRLDSVFAPVIRQLSPADSVYFSFYYQPQGRGEQPEPTDSLVLQFGVPTGNLILDYVDSVTMLIDPYLIANGIDFIYPQDTIFAPEGCNQELYIINYKTLTFGDSVTLPCDSVMKPEMEWTTVWHQMGMSLEEFYATYQVYFKREMIAITDENYFSDGFRFRFFNYGSIADNVSPPKRSNVDQWNVDFLYLNYNRSFTDTSYRKLSFSERAPSFLKRYESMPYRQYRADPTNATAPEFSVSITNLDKIEHNTKYRYTVRQYDGSMAFGYDGGSCNLPPYDEFGFQSCNTGCGAAHACPPVNALFPFNFGLDSTSFLINHYISDSSGANVLVDSMQFHQGFYNYFAYDDGTPEFGYGIEPARGLIAYQFRMTVPDTLQGVQLYFNRTLNDANDKYFDLIVWKDNNGKPGEELYRLPHQRPRWSDQLYGFHMYHFDEPMIVNGVFYVGIMQEESGSLNIGYDVVKNNKQYMFFNVDGVWRNSIYEGSLLMRPVVGSDNFIGIEEANNQLDKQLKVYPNPAFDVIHLSLGNVPQQKQLDCTIRDISGRVVMSCTVTEGRAVDIAQLVSGMYIVVVSEGNQTYTAKLMVAK